MNSKINQSDFENICSFIVDKIKTSNYIKFLKEINLENKVKKDSFYLI